MPRPKKDIIIRNDGCKVCTKCGKIKPLSEFCKNKNKADGLHYQCKECYKIYNAVHSEEFKEYYINNIERIKTHDKEYKLVNSEKAREYSREYYRTHPDYMKDYYNMNIDEIKAYKKQYEKDNVESLTAYKKIYVKQKRESSPLFRMSDSLRTRIYCAFKLNEWPKNKSTENILGCNFEDAHSYIENLFVEGMSWENYGLKSWHIDHIIPISSAKNEDELIKLCHYTNLQPLWAFDNLSKGAKIIY